MQMPKISDVVSLVIGLAVTSAILPLLLKGLQRKEILDLPNERSSHNSPTPRGAGIGQLIGLVASWTSLAWFPFWGFVCASAYCLLGLTDDLKSRRPGLRLSLQLVLGLATASVLLANSASFIVTLLLLASGTAFVVVVVNAANFMDGINGMSAVHGVILGLTYWILLSWQGSEWAPIAAALVGVSLAFLPWNWGRHARMFIGDSGSYLLGALASTFAIVAWESGVDLVIAVGPLAIYLADVLWTILKRLFRRQSLFLAHRDHTYQQLVGVGYVHPQVALIVAVFSSCAALLALISQKGLVASIVSGALTLLLVLLYLLLPRLLMSNGVAAPETGD